MPRRDRSGIIIASSRSTPLSSGAYLIPVPYRAQQSPINLGEAKQFYCPELPDSVSYHYPEHLTGHVVGSAEKTIFVFDTPGSTTGVTLDGTFYQLIQIHYHAPAEHIEFKDSEVKGTHPYPVELHFVHHLPPKIGEPKVEPEDERYVVFGIWVMEKKGETANSHVDRFIGEVAKRIRAKAKDDPSAEDIIDVQLNRLLPPNPEEFYRYEGSLTTKVCDDNYENVQWLIFKNPHVASPNELRKFRGQSHEAKVKQYVNRRFVVRSFR